MDRDQIIRTLKAHEAELRRRGVRRVALFGSVARGDAREDSDIDMMLDLDPAAKISVFDYVDIVSYVQALFAKPVDVANHESLHPHVRPSAEREAIFAF